MNVSCPQCQTVFRVDPSKVPSGGVRARCSVCPGVFFVERPAATAVAAPTPPTPPPAPLSPPAFGAEDPLAILTPRSSPPPQRAPVAAPPAWGGSAPATPLPPSAVPGQGLASPAAAPSVPTPPVPAVARPAAPLATPRQPPPPAASPPPVVPPPAPARVINPFLAQDPATKARRLARALISDLVVYNPARRADGLRDGSLKILFEEEIKKCWEEYTEQVGLEMASSTPYFNEALNEILADGRPVFP